MIRAPRLPVVEGIFVCFFAFSRAAVAAEPEAMPGEPSETKAAPDAPAAAVPAATAAPAASASAAAPASPPEPSKKAPAAPEASAHPQGRELGGHVFTPVLGLVSPFATTSFGTFLLVGAGSTDATVSLPLPGNPPPPPATVHASIQYGALGGVLGFEYQFIPGFSARTVLSDTLYTGLSGAAAASVGTNARLGGGLGFTGSFPIGQSVRVAGVLDMRYAPRVGLVLGPAFRHLYDTCSTGVLNCEFNFGDLVQNRNAFELEPGVAAAWAPMRALGVTGNLSYSFASVGGSQESGSVGGISLGAAVDYDFMAISPVPIALQASFATLIPVTGHDVTWGYSDFGGAIFYTGRKELSVGLQVVDRRFRVAPDVDVSWFNIIALIGLRYYWK